MNDKLRKEHTTLIVEMICKYAELHEFVEKFEKRILLIEKNLGIKNQIIPTEEQNSQKKLSKKGCEK